VTQASREYAYPEKKETGKEGVVDAAGQSPSRALSVELDKPNDPLHRRALRRNGIVVETEHVPDCIEELWLLTARGVRQASFRHRVP